MQFRTTLEAGHFPFSLEHNHSVFCLGSCFSQVIADRLVYNKFDVQNNPFGILFHPKSITKAIERIYTCTEYTEEEIFRHNELYFSWDHNSSLSDPDKQKYLDKINERLRSSLRHLAKTHLVVITLGTAWVHELKDLAITVANCHKVPATKFRKSLLEVNEMVEQIDFACKMLQEINPNVKILLTVSPVRHTKEGLVQNNRSKARLIETVHSCTEKNNYTFYYPSYEMVMDDLRDYRFMEADLIHPNGQAQAYIWKRFEQDVLSEKARELNANIHKIQQQLDHRILHPNTLQAKQFLYACIKQIRTFHSHYKRNDFAEDLERLLQKLSS